MALLPNAAAMAPVASTIPEKLPPLPPEAPLLDSSSINSEDAAVGAGVAVGAAVVLEDEIIDDVDGDVEWLDEDDETKPAQG